MHQNTGDQDPTVAMPRIDLPPPARGGAYHAAGPVEEAVVVGPAPRNVTPVKPVGPRFPVGSPLSYAIARLAAFGIDVGLVAGVLTIFAYALIAINPLTGLPTNTQRGFDVTLLMGTILALVYVIVAEAIAGTTIGKLAFGLHVYALRERGVGFARAFVRMLLRPLDALGVGFVLALAPAHRRLGDLASGTIVTRESPLRGFAPYLGWIAILIIAGLPFVTIGLPRTFAGAVAFYEFVPGIVHRLIGLLHALIGLFPHAA
ncbi:RDD family protein [Vulcanimicrobium alpinum]|nr:RDD family protein [Vulcanimicrobium alpinum]